MPKRTKETGAFSKTGNGQKFSTFRLIPVINQKNYFTNYLKKDSQYMCRKIRERGEDDDTLTVILQLGSENLKIGFSDDEVPKIMPFCIAKPQPLYSSSQRSVGGDGSDGTESSSFEDALVEVNQSFVDRMKFYKTRIVGDAKQTCEQFNARQKGESVHTEDSTTEYEDGNTKAKYFCESALQLPANATNYNVFWPLHRGALNENPAFYRSPQELKSDIYEILKYAATSKNGLNISDLSTKNYDLVLVVSDLQERTALIEIIDTLFSLGFANVAIIEEAVAATYGAGISAACVVDIGSETTTVSCVDDGACVSNSRVKLDFGGNDITRAFGQLLERIAFPGNPDFRTLDQLKQRFCTVNESDISVQLYQYTNVAQKRKYDFKVYNEVMLPILGLFYPELFSLPSRNSWRFSLFPPAVDPYTGHSNEPISDADINIRLGTLAVLSLSYEEHAPLLNSNNASSAALAGAGTSNTTTTVDDADVSMIDVDDADNDGDVSRDGTPAPPNTNKVGEAESISQLKAYESLDLAKPAVAALDHAIIESIAQATKQGSDPKQYYENLLVVGGGSKVPSFHAMLTDRLVMWNQQKLKEIGDVAVMAMPRDMDEMTICWRGGSVYSKLKIIDEMWTTKEEWDTLGSRTLHYKAALYMY